MGLLTALLASSAPGAEYLDEDRPAPGNAKEELHPVDVAVQPPEKVERLVRLQGLKKRLANAPPVLRDATLVYKFRTYDFRRENPDGSRNDAWGIGGEIALETGELFGLVKGGASYYISQAISDPKRRDGSMILGPKQSNIYKLGQLWGQIGDEKKLAARLGRQVFSLPYINIDVSRMIPRTHEAYVIARRGTGRDFLIGHFLKTKAQGSEKFVYMSEAAGGGTKDRGVSALVGRLAPGENAVVGVFNYYGWDLYNTLYLEADWNGRLFDDFGIKLGAQYTKQDSVGDELVGDFDTDHVGLKASGSHLGAVLSLAYTWTDDGGAIRRDWGSPPGYNFRLLATFDRANEQSFGVGLSSTGRHFGAPWLSGAFHVVRGWDAEDETTGASLPDVTQFDAALIARPTQGLLKGLDFRLVYAVADFDGGTDSWNTRVIVNYRFDLL